MKCVLISVDLRKAFETESHRKLKNKLIKYGCDIQTMKWINSYLTSRKQLVKLSNNVSQALEIDSISVPQEDNLSSEFFITYINDMTNALLNSKTVLYADDSTFIIFGKSYEELQLKLNEDIESLYTWLRDNELILNENKSNFMIMSRPRDEIDLYVKIGNQLIKRVKSTKILGVIIDQSLHFEEHINDICEKANIRLNFISRLRYSVPKSTVKLIFEAMVFPIIKYCSPIIGYTYAKHTNRLEILIRRAARITTFSGLTPITYHSFKNSNEKFLLKL
jgi:hypothetical protein